MVTTKEISSELLTVKEATTYLKCSRVFFWRIRGAKKIQTVKAEGKVLIPKASIDAYLNLNPKEVSNAK